MTIIKGFDCGAKTIGYAKTLAADGMRFAGRYLTRGDDWRTLHLPEVEELHAAGIAVVCIFQHKSDTPEYFSEASALIDANRAIVRAKALRLPPMCAIYFAVDTDVTAGNEARVLEYARTVERAVRDQPWWLGWYGDDRVVKRVLGDLDLGHLAYLANATGWREAAIPDDGDIIQKPERRHPCGLSIDDCEIEEVDDDERTRLKSVGAWVP